MCGVAALPSLSLHTSFMVLHSRSFVDVRCFCQQYDSQHQQHPPVSRCVYHIDDRFRLVRHLPVFLDDVATALSVHHAACPHPAGEDSVRVAPCAEVLRKGALCVCMCVCIQCTSVQEFRKSTTNQLEVPWKGWGGEAWEGWGT